MAFWRARGREHARALVSSVEMLLLSFVGFVECLAGSPGRFLVLYLVTNIFTQCGNEERVDSGYVHADLACFTNFWCR